MTPGQSEAFDQALGLLKRCDAVRGKGLFVPRLAEDIEHFLASYDDQRFAHLANSVVLDDVRELRRLLNDARVALLIEGIWSSGCLCKRCQAIVEIDSALARTAHYEPAADNQDST